MTEKFYSSEGSAGTSLLRDAHIGVEAMSAAAALIKQEQWVEAERALAELQAILPAKSIIFSEYSSQETWLARSFAAESPPASRQPTENGH